MKRLLVVVTFFLMLCFSVYAHRPIAIKIEPDFKNDKLTIRIIHPVTNPRKRYIKKVEVLIDDRKPLVYRFFFQIGDKKEFSISVPDLDKAEKLIIRAYCVKGGMREEEFNLKEFKDKELKK